MKTDLEYTLAIRVKFPRSKLQRAWNAIAAGAFLAVVSFACGAFLGGRLTDGLALLVVATLLRLEYFEARVADAIANRMAVELAAANPASDGDGGPGA